MQEHEISDELLDDTLARMRPILAARRERRNPMPTERDWLGELQEAGQWRKDARDYHDSLTFQRAKDNHYSVQCEATRAGFRWSNCAQCGKPIAEGAVTCMECGEGNNDGL